MIKFKQGDLLEAFKNGEIEVIAHQENCISKQYKGIAKIIHNLYPETIDRNRYFGNITVHNTINGIVVNMYSQYYPGSPSDKLFIKYDYEIPDNYHNRIIALQNCLKSIKANYSDKKIGLPLIASGLAKNNNLKHSSDLDYFVSYIYPVIEDYFKYLDVTIYYL